MPEDKRIRDAELTRPEDYLYTLLSKPNYRYVVARGSNSQAIAGFVGDCVVLVTFDLDGNFTGVQTKVVVDLPTISCALAGDDGAIWDRVLEYLGSQSDLDLYGGPIEVKRFTVSQLGIGISDFESRNPLEDSTLDECREWLERGNFCVFWGRCLWVDAQGLVFAS